MGEKRVKRQLGNKLFSSMLAMVVVFTTIFANDVTGMAAVKPAITLSSKQETIAAGKSVQLKVKAVKGLKSKSVTWKSSNTKIAKVSSKGKVIGLKAGNAKIIATSKNNKKVKATCKITVKKAAVDTICLDKTACVLVKGKTTKVKVQKVLPTAASGNVTWKVKNNSIAQVSGKGKTAVITGKKAGKTTLTATAADGSKKTAKVEIVVVNKKSSIKQVTGVQVKLEKEEVFVGDTVKAKAVVTPSKATLKTVFWSSNNEKIAKIDSSGKITALQLGQVKITATSQDGSGKKGTITLIVKENGVPTKEPEATETPTITVEPTQKPEISEEPTVEPVVTKMPTATPTERPEISKEPTIQPTEEPGTTTVPTGGIVVTQIPTTNPTPTPDITKEPMVTPTEEPEVTNVPEASETPTPIPTGELEVTQTVTPTIIPEVTEEAEVTPTTVPKVTETPTEIWYESVEEAGNALREEMKKRNTTVELKYKTSEAIEDGSIASAIATEACKHTKVPTEGDYLTKQMEGYAASLSWYSTGGTNYLTITYTITYYTTAEQETEMDAAVETVMQDLNLEGAEDEQKVQKIYDYICKNVEYDYTNLENESYKLKYTAYAALVNKTSVCQGYANLLYRMLLEAGIDSRIVTGVSTENGERHAWNIVKLEDKYYYLDATWDAPIAVNNGTYEYFLRGTADFKKHALDTEYETDEFKQEYSISESMYQ